jgi:hypothetical protein
VLNTERENRKQIPSLFHGGSSSKRKINSLLEGSAVLFG